MDRDEIKTLLPHREPMLLVDTVTDEDGKAYGTYTVRGDEWFLKGHFPGNPVVPGVVLCEMLAQTCSMLIKEQLIGRVPYFTGIDKVKFRNKVLPGDTLKMECALKRVRHPFYFAEGSGYVDGKLAVSGQFSFALVDKE